MTKPYLQTHILRYKRCIDCQCIDTCSGELLMPFTLWRRINLSDSSLLDSGAYFDFVHFLKRSWNTQSWIFLPKFQTTSVKPCNYFVSITVSSGLCLWVRVCHQPLRDLLPCSGLLQLGKRSLLGWFISSAVNWSQISINNIQSSWWSY